MTLGERFDHALAFASELHREQKRKGTQVPYVSHLLAVAAIAIEHGASEDEAVAALLHDSIEDQGEGSGGANKLRATIRERFGDEVLAIVEGCTDTDSVPKPPWKATKERYIAHLETAPSSVLLVTGADKLHNARSIVSELFADGDAVWKRFRGGKDGTLWYYRSVCHVLLRRMPGRLSDELARAVLEMSALAAPRPSAPPSESSTQTGA
ncbi:MAG: HD domain-containing protein [Planctomycetota bacterium]